MPRSAREQVILRVAGQVFAEGGYERASMVRIAGLAGVSKPMLYAYFDSKEGLYIAYIERTGGELVKRLVSADRADGAHPPTGRLRAVINEFLAFVEEHSDGWTVLFRELGARGRWPSRWPGCAPRSSARSSGCSRARATRRGRA